MKLRLDNIAIALQPPQFRVASVMRVSTVQYSLNLPGWDFEGLQYDLQSWQHLFRNCAQAHTSPSSFSYLPIAEVGLSSELSPRQDVYLADRWVLRAKGTSFLRNALRFVQSMKQLYAFIASKALSSIVILILNQSKLS
jgi:hypothetical protein